MEPDSPPDSPTRPLGANSHEDADTRTNQNTEGRVVPNEGTGVEGGQEDRDQKEIENNNHETTDDIERSEDDEKIEDIEQAIENTANTADDAEKATEDAEQESEHSQQENEDSGEESEDARQETEDVDADHNGAEAGDQPDYENDQTTDDIESDGNTTTGDNDRLPIHDRETNPMDEEVEELSDSDIYRAGDDDEDSEVQPTNPLQDPEDFIPLALRRDLCEPRPRPNSWAQESTSPASSHRNLWQLGRQDTGGLGRRPTSLEHQYISPMSSTNLLRLTRCDTGSPAAGEEFTNPLASPNDAFDMGTDGETDNQGSLAENDLLNMKEHFTRILSDLTALTSQVENGPPAGPSREELLAEIAALEERIDGPPEGPSREELFAEVATLSELVNGRPGEPSREELLADVATLLELVNGRPGEPTRDELFAEISALEERIDGPPEGPSREELLAEVATLSELVNGRPGEPTREELLAENAALSELRDGPAGEPSREDLLADIAALTTESTNRPPAGPPREDLLAEIATISRQNVELRREIQSLCNERDLITAEFTAMKDSQKEVEIDEQVDIATTSAALKNTLRQSAWAYYGEEPPLPNTQPPAEKPEDKGKGVEGPEKATTKKLRRLDVGGSSAQGAKSEWGTDNVWEHQQGTGGDGNEPDTPHPDSAEASPKKTRSRSSTGSSRPLGSIDESVEGKGKDKLSGLPDITSASSLPSGGRVRESLVGFEALDSGMSNPANRSPGVLQSASSMGSGLSPFGWREAKQSGRHRDSSTSLGDGVRNTLDEEMNMPMLSPPFSGGMGTFEGLPASAGSRHGQSLESFSPQASGSHGTGPTAVPPISTPTKPQPPQGPQHGREGEQQPPVEEGEAAFISVKVESKLSKRETAKSSHVWVVLAYCVLFFFTVQVLISCRRQKHIWFAANGLTRNYMLDAYRFDRTWLGGVGIDTALFSNWSEAQEWLVNLWPFGEGAKAFRW